MYISEDSSTGLYTLNEDHGLSKEDEKAVRDLLKDKNSYLESFHEQNNYNYKGKRNGLHIFETPGYTLEVFIPPPEAVNALVEDLLAKRRAEKTQQNDTTGTQMTSLPNQNITKNYKDSIEKEKGEREDTEEIESRKYNQF